MLFTEDWDKNKALWCMTSAATTLADTRPFDCSTFRLSVREDLVKAVQENLKIEMEIAKRITPKRIQKNGHATIVFWEDGTKTIVKRGEGEEDNDYAAFTAALGIKLFGSNSKLKKYAAMRVEQKPRQKKCRCADAQKTEREECGETDG